MQPPTPTHAHPPLPVLTRLAALPFPSRSFLSPPGQVDDLRRATELARRAVAEFGLSTAVGPLSVAALAAGGDEYGAPLLRDGGGHMAG